MSSSDWLAELGLELDPDKTAIVYCKDANRKGSYEHEQFDFLGYRFRPRLAKNRRGQFFVGFAPAISDTAAKEIRRQGDTPPDQTMASSSPQ